MNPTPDDRKYATARAPVNRRTTLPPPARPAPQAPAVKARMRVAQARQRLGAPLQQQLAAARNRSSDRAHPGAVTIVQAIGGTISATGVLLGAIQSAWLTLGASAALLCGFGAWAVWTWRKRPQGNAPGGLDLGLVVEESDIQRLDAAMETLAAEVPEATMRRLADLKESIRRCVGLMAGLAPGSGFASDDQLYVRECIRRYIPDSIQSCLQVPIKDRASLVIDGTKPALDLLHEQIDMIQAGLQTREDRLTQLAGESLMRQQRFLAAKSGGSI